MPKRAAGGGAGARKAAKPAGQSVNNSGASCTLNSYFAPVSNATNNATTNNNNHAPAVAELSEPKEEEADRSWLPAKPANTSRLRQLCGGALRVKCTRGCAYNSMGKNPSMFVPRLSPRDEDAYEQAMADLATAMETRDAAMYLVARDTIEELASAWCDRCRVSKSKSQHNPDTKRGACEAEWERMKREEFSKCGRCGTERAIEANHGKVYADNAEKYNEMKNTHGEDAAEKAYPAEGRKIECVSCYSYWSWNGGVDAMCAEVRKCTPLCRMCHVLDPASTTSEERRADPDKVKEEKYDTRKKFTNALYHARYRKEKRDYVNKIKRGIRMCANPNCPRDGPSDGLCIEGFEQCYDFDHIVEKTKKYEISELVGSNYCFKTEKPKIDAELPKCRLLCRNCHHLRKQWDP